MRYDKKGITLISTVIIIVVLFLFAGTIVISVDNIIEETDKREFNREYRIIEAATQDYIMRNNGIIDFEDTILDLSKISTENLEQFEGETVVDDMIQMYIINLEKIGVINTTYGIKAEHDQDDVYLLSKSTNTVYYKKGYEYNNKIYYINISD